MSASSFGADANPLASDDPLAWERLVEATNPASMLVAIQHRMSPAMRARVSPEDLWQETLLIAWRDRRQFQWRGLTSFRRWLLSICENRLRNQVEAATARKRGGGASAQCLPDEASGATDQDPMTPSRVAVNAELAHNLATTLATLPEDLREVVYLRLFDGLELEEITARLQLTLAAVRHRLRRGGELYRQRLRRLAGSTWQRPDSATSADHSPA